MKSFLSTVFAAAFIGASASASPALAQETRPLDNLYACVGYYRIFQMLPASRQYGEKQLSKLYKIIMTIEGKSFAEPNDLSEITMAGFQDENGSDEFVEKTRNADKSCTDTIVQYSSVARGEAVPMSEGPNVAMIVHNKKLVTGRAAYEADRASAFEGMFAEAQRCATVFRVETDQFPSVAHQRDMAFFWGRAQSLAEKNSKSELEFRSGIFDPYQEISEMRSSMTDKYTELLDTCRELRTSLQQ